MEDEKYTNQGSENEKIDDKVEILKKNSGDLKLNLIDFDKNLEKTVEYFLEEIEIRVESLKIELDEASNRLKRKLRILERNLLKSNEEFYCMIDEDNLFKHVTLFSLDMKVTGLNFLFRYFNSKLFFEANKSLIISKHVGKMYRDVTYISRKILREARNAIDLINASDITELRNYRCPSNTIILVAEALCCVLGWREDWDTIKKSSRKKLLNAIMRIDIDDFDPVRFEKLERYINYRELDPNTVRTVSHSCSSIVMWISGFYRYQEIKRGNLNGDYIITE